MHASRAAAGRLAVLLPVILAGAALLDSPVVRAQRETREHHVYASVADKNDAPIRDLSATDFAVKEDGVAREVLRVGTASAPMQLALLVDTSAAAQPLTMNLRAAAAAFIQQVLAASPTSEIALVSFGERPTTEVDYTSSAIALLKAAGSLLPRPGSGAYMLTAITDACKALKTRSATRPIIVAFTSEAGPEFGDARHDRITDALKGAHATLWTIALKGAGLGTEFSSSSEGLEREHVLNDVTVASGGQNRFLLSQQALESSFTTLATLLTSQYDITYARPVTTVPPNKLDITVKRPGVRLWAPRWAGQ